MLKANMTCFGSDGAEGRYIMLHGDGAFIRYILLRLRFHVSGDETEIRYFMHV